MRTVALDAMGGDHGPSFVVPAALDALQEQADLRVVLVGHRDAVNAELAKSGKVNDARLRLVHADDVVSMEDAPAQALRNKKDSSMRVAMDLVKRGEAQACVSAGNTGALMAIARFVLKTLPGIDRPAIVSRLPCATGHTYLLDLGANVDASPAQLYQFALMGSVLATAVDRIAAPSIGLLNIGEETIKGNDTVRGAARLLQASSLNYIGFVEGHDIYGGKANVVVCDGFSGNVCLKSSEGVAKMMADLLREEFKRNWLTRMAGLFAMPVIDSFRNRVDPRRYNGATLIGLRGIVVKSHGGADAFAIKNAILKASAEIQENVPDMISAQLAPMLTHEEAV